MGHLQPPPYPKTVASPVTHSPLLSCQLCPKCCGLHYGDLCELSFASTHLVGKQLQAAYESQRMLQPSEEALTYSLVRLIRDWSGTASLVTAGEVTKAEEANNGADLEVWLKDSTVRVSEAWFCWRIQAKRSNLDLGKQKVERMDHMVGADFQCDLLISGSNAESNVLPVYWIYSLADAGIQPLHVVPAERIAHRVHWRKAGNVNRPPHWSSLANVADDGWPLCDLWCRPSNGQHALLPDGLGSLQDKQPSPNPPDYVLRILDSEPVNSDVLLPKAVLVLQRAN